MTALKSAAQSNEGAANELESYRHGIVPHRYLYQNFNIVRSNKLEKKNVIRCIVKNKLWLKRD